jgi:hypothetical protein
MEALTACCHCVAHVRQESFDQVVEDCTEALSFKRSYVKALARRAQAFEKLEKYDEALEGPSRHRAPLPVARAIMPS